MPRDHNCLRRGASDLPPELRPPMVVEQPEGSGVYVRLNDSYLRSIAYLGCAKPGSETEIDATGTAFLVAHDDEAYLVTAAHVAVDYQDGPMVVRLNRYDNGLGGLEFIDTANWYWHPDDRIDVAVMPFKAPTWARVWHFPTEHFATDFKLKTKDFGTGDLAYVVGMFSRMQGKEKNVPVVHTGHIGSMGAGEKLVADDWRSGARKDAELEVQGYLIQAPTLPGSSGSPVFVRRTLELTGVREVSGKTSSPVRAWTYGSVWLLGLWSAAWNEKENAQSYVIGMGVCIPAHRILEALDQKDLKAMRQAAKDKERQRTKLTQQKAEKPAKSSGNREAENPNHREEFDRLLTKAAQPVKQKK